MAGTVIADNLQAASTSTLVIKNGVANTPPRIQDSAGTTIGTFCRAWVNFNGTGTVAIRASFNVSSITDNGTGNYRVNLTNAMPDTNYVMVIGSDYQPTLGTHSANRIKLSASAVSTSQFGLYFEDQYFTTVFDGEVLCAAVFR
jgi:hypothetical protein